MNKNLADKIEESLNKRIISKTLLLICIAKLWERTTFTKQDNKERREKRDLLAKFVLANQYISKDEIGKILPTISMECCPSYDRIDKVVEIINNGEYTYDESFIPERWIKYKSAEQIREDLQRKTLADYQVESQTNKAPKKQKEMLSEDELQAREKLYRYVEKRILGYEDGIVLNSIQMASIDSLVNGSNKNLRQSQEIKYTYDLILRTFKYCTKEIDKNLIGKCFRDENHKLNYICKVASAYINTVYQRPQHIPVSTGLKVETYEEQMERFKRGHPSIKMKEKTGMFEDAF